MRLRQLMTRLFAPLVLLAALLAPSTAAAEVEVHFHSFNGSVLLGRYPHTFVVFEGALEDGTPVNENYGFTARKISPAILTGPVEHMVYVEKPKYIRSTNRHFTITVDDQTYRRMRTEVDAWRNAPGKFYDLDTRNCIHFVGEIAKLGGLKVEYPDNMLRKPKAWLNHVTRLNPKLRAQPID